MSRCSAAESETHPVSEEFEDIIESNSKAARRFRPGSGRAAFAALGLVIAVAAGLVLLVQHTHEEPMQTFPGYIRSSPAPDLAAIALLLCPSRDCDFSPPSPQLARSLRNTFPGVTNVAGFTITSGAPDRALVAFAIQGYTKSGVTVVCAGQRLRPHTTVPLPILRDPQDGISLVMSTATADRGLWQLTSQVIGGSYDSLPLESAQLWLARAPVPGGD